ncbi:MAG TPA: PDZ domain-containing protein [Amycolatopsis sp.]|nr:PDZ domain-containing protein [Amycolatopsis sp.]
MSESREETTTRSTDAPDAKPGDTASAKRGGRTPRYGRRIRLSRRGWTVLLSVLLVIAFGLVGAFVQVPYVALGPGPTFDTLGDAGGAPVIQISGRETYPTTGELRMTTVSLNDQITLFGALGLWASGRYALAPREDYFKPGETDEQVQQENVKEFQDSQSNAEVAALRHLGLPIKVLAQEVVSGSPADKALAAGDRLLEVNGKQIGNEDDVRSALTATKPGQTISITFQHGTDAPRTASLTLASNPDSGQSQGFMGLQPIDRADVPFDVKVSLQDVGGPSAGLMFALAITDRLTPGDLANRTDIAGTGEIDEKGNVGPIGGISFKVVAAREAGATVFLTPAANCTEAASAAPSGLKLVKVSSLDSALTALQDLKNGKPTPSC